jgi:hypothetical protein
MTPEEFRLLPEDKPAAIFAPNDRDESLPRIKPAADELPRDTQSWTLRREGSVVEAMASGSAVPRALDNRQSEPGILSSISRPALCQYMTSRFG